MATSSRQRRAERRAAIEVGRRHPKAPASTTILCSHNNGNRGHPHSIPDCDAHDDIYHGGSTTTTVSSCGSSNNFGHRRERGKGARGRAGGTPHGRDDEERGRSGYAYNDRNGRERGTGGGEVGGSETGDEDGAEDDGLSVSRLAWRRVEPRPSSSTTNTTNTGQPRRTPSRATRPSPSSSGAAGADDAGRNTHAAHDDYAGAGSSGGYRYGDCRTRSTATAAVDPGPGIVRGIGRSGNGYGGGGKSVERRGGSPARALAARLGELEAKVAFSRGGGGGGEGGLGPRFGGCMLALGGAGNGGTGQMSAAESEVQSAALRHALLLEERGLQLERAEARLRKKEEEEKLTKRELHRLSEASIADRDAWRRLAKAENEISSLLERSEALEGLASDCQTALEKERLARREERDRHASELKRANAEAAAAAEAASRQEFAAKSSRDLGEQMSAVCSQMRTAAEEAGARSAEAEETSRSLQEELSLMQVAAKEAGRKMAELRGKLEAAEHRAEREACLLGEKVEAAGREAKQMTQALNDAKDTTFALRELLKDREARLERAERDAAAKRQASERCEEVSEGLRAGLQRSQREADQLRSRLEAAVGLAADEAGKAKESSQAEKAARSQLVSSGEREETLRSENAALVVKTQELRQALDKLSAELTASTRLSQDRLVDCERGCDEARRSAESAQSLVVRAEAARAEGESALIEFQAWMTHVLQDVEDALADALQGIICGGERSQGLGAGSDVGNSGSSSISRTRGGQEACVGHYRSRRSITPPAKASTKPGVKGGREGGRGEENHGSVSLLGRSIPFLPAPTCARSGGRSGGGVEEVPAVAAADTAAATGRLERLLSRVMRRITGVRELRLWVTREVERAGTNVKEGLDELRGSWETELGRLQAAENKLLKLQEQAKYGGRRAALAAREECYAKIERVEKEKWALRDCLISEDREVEVLRAHVKRLKDASDKAAASAERTYRAACDDLEEERGRRQRLQDKTELLEGKLSLLEERLSALSTEVGRYKADELQLKQDKERLSRSQEALQSRLKKEVQTAERARRELLDRMGTVRKTERQEQSEWERAETDGERLTKLLQQEREYREKERVSTEKEAARLSELLEHERVARDEETTRLTSLLEEERRARRAESALGEAVLREVRETQGLLGEGGGAPEVSRPLRESTRKGRSVLGGVDIPSALRLQASMLERIVADAAELIKHTGHFYDRYSATHKAHATGRDVSGKGTRDALANTTNGASFGHFPSCREGGDPVRQALSTTEKSVHETRSGARGSFGVSGVNRQCDGFSGSYAPTLAAESRPWCGQEYSRNRSDRTLEQDVGTTEAGSAGADVPAAVRELDQRCYSLLESNAQLCLRLQGLGLEYAGLTRALMTSGGKLRLQNTRRHYGLGHAEEPLNVADLEDINVDVVVEPHLGQNFRHRRHRADQQTSHDHYNQQHRLRRHDEVGPRYHPQRRARKNPREKRTSPSASEEEGRREREDHYHPSAGGCVNSPVERLRAHWSLGYSSDRSEPRHELPGYCSPPTIRAFASSRGAAKESTGHHQQHHR